MTLISPVNIFYIYNHVFKVWRISGSELHWKQDFNVLKHQIFCSLQQKRRKFRGSYNIKHSLLQASSPRYSQSLVRNIIQDVVRGHVAKTESPREERQRRQEMFVFDFQS